MPKYEAVFKTYAAAQIPEHFTDLTFDDGGLIAGFKVPPVINEYTACDHCDSEGTVPQVTAP